MKSGDLVLGLSIHADQLYGVWTRGEKRDHTDTLPLGFGGLAETVLALMKKFPEKPARVVMAVPLHRVFLRSIDLPPSDELPLGLFAEQFASTELPYPVEEAVIDYSVRPAGTTRRMVLLAAPKKEIETTRAALGGLGVSSVVVVSSTLAVLECAALPESSGNMILFFIWQNNLELIWCAGGRPRHLRVVPVQADRLIKGVTARDPDVLGGLARDLRLSAELIRKQTGVEYHSILARFVTCDKLLDDELPSLLQHEVPFTVEGRLMDGPEGSMLAAGAAMAGMSDPPEFNLYDPKKSSGATVAVTPETRKEKRMAVALSAVMAILVIAILKTVLSYSWVVNAQASRESAVPASENGLPEGAGSQLHAFLVSSDAVDVLGQLSGSLPPETQIQDLSIDATQISITGTATRAMSVYEGLAAQGFPNVRLVQDIVADEKSGQERFGFLADNPFAPPVQE